MHSLQETNLVNIFLNIVKTVLEKEVSTLILLKFKSFKETITLSQKGN